MYITLLWLLILLFVISWLSLIKSSLISINTNKIKVLADAGEKNALLLSKYISKFGMILGFIQVGLTFSILFCGTIGFDSLSMPLTYYLMDNGINFPFSVVEKVSDIVIIVIIGMLILIFGEFVPKRFGIKSPEKIAYKNIKRIYFLSKIFYPLTYIINIVSNSVVKIFGIDPNEIDANITEEEIRLLVDAGGDNGTIDENEKEMINNIFEFDNLTAGEIATHRTDIVALPTDATLEDVKNIINSERYSRVPVYQDSLDDIVGIFHIRDIAQYILNNSEIVVESEFQISKIMRKPYYVPFSKKSDELMEEMQKNKVHMAIVIDEYGGTAGIVTMEDLLERIVGNIFDEYDLEEDEEIKVVDENTFVVLGTTDLDEINDIVDFNFDEEDEQEYDTIGGYLIGHFGRIPDDGELPEIVINNYKFKVERIEDKRIEEVRITKL